ncbi:MAG: hypothetical protein ABFS42_02885 [Candidatus Krumholzibacteriota bacterium]
MSDDDKQEEPRRRLIEHHHKKRPLRTWVIPLLIILAIILFLPKLVGLLEK